MAFALLRIFVFAFILLNYANCDEPKCSKFSFEESLLEKMVRIEFEVEKFSKGLKEKYEEIDRIKTAAKEKLQQLRHDREVWKAEIERLKIESIQTIKNQTGEHSCTCNRCTLLDIPIQNEQWVFLTLSVKDLSLV